MIKDLASESPVLLRGYAAAMALGAAWAGLRGSDYRRAQLLLRAWRNAGAEALGRKRLEQLHEIIRRCCYSDRDLVPVAENRFLREFVRTREAAELRRRFGALPPAARVRLRDPLPHD
ncbi:MAG: hypothetical protein ACREMQ_16520, partial [Longimicrobiales bacterium]